MKKLYTAIGLALSLGLPLTAQASTLIGDSVQGSMSSFLQNPLTQQFTSPAIVGAGVEFSGQITDFANQIWDIAVDIGASQFTVGITSSNPYANVRTSPTVGLLSINLSDLNWVGQPGSIITGVTNTAYSCTPLGSYVCTNFGGSPYISNLSFADHSIAVSFSRLNAGELYTFAINGNAQDAPEPASLALLSIGLTGFGVMRRRKMA